MAQSKAVSPAPRTMAVPRTCLQETQYSVSSCLSIQLHTESRNDRKGGRRGGEGEGGSGKAGEGGERERERGRDGGGREEEGALNYPACWP